MMRTPLLWFTLGFSVTGASISQFVWRDLWTDRYSLSSEMNQKFDALKKRVSALESLAYREPESIQDEG